MALTSKLSSIGDAIRSKTGGSSLLTLDQMPQEIASIPTGSTPTLQTKTVTPTLSQLTVSPDTGYDGLSQVTVAAIPMAEEYIADVGSNDRFVTLGNQRAWQIQPKFFVDVPGWIGGDVTGDWKSYPALPPTTVTPTTSAQTIGNPKVMLEGAITVAAMPTGTAGTPTATKSISNHTASITPSVTNTTGYITGGTKTGSPVTVSASELVSGSYTVSSSGTHNVTNYANATVPTGAVTVSANKGTVTNHTITITPSYTQSAGWITTTTGTGTPVTVSASELVSGTQTVTANDTYDVTNLASMVVNVQGGEEPTAHMGITSASITTTASTITFSNLLGQPTSFYILGVEGIPTSADKLVAAAVWDGTTLHTQNISNTTNAQVSYDAGGYYNYANNTLEVHVNNYFMRNCPYGLLYTYGGGTIGTKQASVGSGATSITFTGLEEEPLCWYLIFQSNFSTSSGYQRVISVADNSIGLLGLEMDSAARYSEEHWTSTYNNGSLTITSQGTNAGGYFHQPGNYLLVYVLGGTQEIEVEPLTVTANGTYSESGKAYSPVTVNVPTGGSTSIAQTTWSNTSTATVSHQFTGLSGTPKFAVLRCTSQLTRSSSNTYYYIATIIWDGTDAWGNYHLRSNGTFNNVAKNAASGFNVTVSGSSITFSSDATSRSSAPGSFYNGTYELTYVY